LDFVNDPGGAVSIEPVPVSGDEYRALSSLADGKVDSSGGTRCERDRDDLATLAKHRQGAMPTFEPECFDVGLVGTSGQVASDRYRLAYIHVHSLLRLDPLDRAAVQHDAAMPATAVLDAANKVSAPNPIPAGPPIRWGRRTQVDVVAIDGRSRLASYLSKYTTKSIDAGGALDHRLGREDLARLGIDEHLERLVKACWDLGADPRLRAYRFREWAHTLAFRGHWLTKSPNRSTTLTALRQARHDYQLQRAQAAPTDGVPVTEWAYAGEGHRTEGDAFLAASTAARRYRNRRIAWEER
jgi:hypothetical protein